MQLPEKYGQAQLVYGIYSCVSSIVQYGFPGYNVMRHVPKNDLHTIAPIVGALICMQFSSQLDTLAQFQL